MIKTVLITGGSGLIGKPLTKALLEKGYTVRHLSREAKTRTDGVQVFKWDVKNREIDPACIENVNAVIHLAGEGIAARPWTSAQKKELIESRTESIRLIYQLIRSSANPTVREVISASGVGFYGNRGDELLAEGAPAGQDFMARCCIEWEQAVDEIADLDVRIVKLRTGVVLTKNGGALQTMATPVKMGMGAALGNGKQWMPWIHLRDMVDLYLYALEKPDLRGTFNAAAPSPETNKAFTHALAKALHKRIWLPAVPAIALRIALGEMKAVVLNSTKTSSDKLLSMGFNFTFESLNEALTDIYAAEKA